MRKTPSIIFIILFLVIIALWYTVCLEKQKDEEPFTTGLKNASGEVTEEFQFHDSVTFAAEDLSPRTGYSVRIVREDGHIVRDLRLVSDSLGRIPETIIWYNVGIRLCDPRIAAPTEVMTHLSEDEIIDPSYAMGYRLEIATLKDKRLVREMEFEVVDRFDYPVLFAADSRGCPKSGFLIGEENIWVVGKNFPKGSMIRLWAVPASGDREEGETLVDKTQQHGYELPPLFVLKGEETGFKKLLWPRNFTSLGSYDIVAEVVTYDFGTYRPEAEAEVQNVVSYLSHSGFVVQRRAGALEDLEVDIAGTRQSPYTFRDTFLTDEDVWVGVDPCIQPSKVGDTANVYIVADKNAAQWTQHVNDASDLLDDDDVTGTVTTITVGGICGNCWKQLAWPKMLTVGDYDVVLDFDQDKRYTPGTDLIDGLDKVGFTVSEIRVDTITFTPGSGKITIYDNLKKVNVTGPEYEAVNIVNKPVAWIMGSSHSVSVTFKAASTLGSALVWAENGLGGLAGSGSPVSVTLSGGSGSGTFAVNSVPTSIGKHSFYWDWKYKKTSSGSALGMGITGEHLLYTVHSTPQAPMQEPWSEVLEYATDWASGETSAAGVSGKIVNGIYNSGVEYSGAQHHTHPGKKTFHLNQLFTELRTTGLQVKMDCRDCANFFHCLTNALGFNYQYMVIKDNTSSGFFYKSMWPMGHTSCNAAYWNYHQVGWCGSMVADGSTKLDCPPPLVTAKCDLTAAAYFGYLSNETLAGVEYDICSPQK
jgi:hypothetical protein